MYIKPRVYISKKYSKLNHIKYNDYFNFNQDTKTQLENLLNFIGKTLVLFIDDISYEFLSDEMNIGDYMTGSIKIHLHLHF